MKNKILKVQRPIPYLLFGYSWLWNQKKKKKLFSFGFKLFIKFELLVEVPAHFLSSLSLSLKYTS